MSGGSASDTRGAIAVWNESRTQDDGSEPGTWGSVDDDEAIDLHKRGYRGITRRMSRKVDTSWIAALDADQVTGRPFTTAPNPSSWSHYCALF